MTRRTGRRELLMAVLMIFTDDPVCFVLMGPNGSRAVRALTVWHRHAGPRGANVLFGAPYDEARYTQVLEACALTAAFPSAKEAYNAIAGKVPGLDEIEQHILTAMHTATQHSGAGAHSHEHSH